MLISPTESEALRALGTSTWRAEDYGADIFWVGRGETYGVQRKALKDLIASVDDGRLSKELLQMQSLDHPFLVLETGERGGGAPREMPNTTLAGVGKFGRPWTGAQLRGVLYGVMARGVHVICVKDEAETIERVRELETWSKKERHEAAKGRGQVPKDVFGKRGEKEYGVWLLSSLPGMGVEIASRVWDEFGGLPMRMKDGVDEAALTKVKGVGKVTARRILEVFGDG